MKIFLVGTFLIAGLLPLSSHAQVIVGANFNTSIGGEIEAEVKPYSETFDIDTTSLSFHVGIENERNNRVLLGFDNLTMKDDEGEKIKATGFRLDSQFVYGKEQIKPYFGLGLGFYKMKDSPFVDEVQRGVSFQLMGGAKVELAANLELDLVLQLQAIAWQDIEYTDYSGFYPTTETLSISSNQTTLGAGITYKF